MSPCAQDDPRSEKPSAPSKDSVNHTAEDIRWDLELAPLNQNPTDPKLISAALTKLGIDHKVSKQDGKPSIALSPNLDGHPINVLCHNLESKHGISVLFHCKNGISCVGEDKVARLAAYSIAPDGMKATHSREDIIAYLKEMILHEAQHAHDNSQVRNKYGMAPNQYSNLRETPERDSLYLQSENYFGASLSELKSTTISLISTLRHGAGIASNELFYLDRVYSLIDNITAALDPRQMTETPKVDVYYSNDKLAQRIKYTTSTRTLIRGTSRVSDEHKTKFTFDEAQAALIDIDRQKTKEIITYWIKKSSLLSDNGSAEKFCAFLNKCLLRLEGKSDEDLNFLPTAFSASGVLFKDLKRFLSAGRVEEAEVIPPLLFESVYDDYFQLMDIIGYLLNTHQLPEFATQCSGRLEALRPDWSPNPLIAFSEMFGGDAQKGLLMLNDLDPETYSTYTKHLYSGVAHDRLKQPYEALINYRAALGILFETPEQERGFKERKVQTQLEARISELVSDTPQ